MISRRVGLGLVLVLFRSSLHGQTAVPQERAWSAVTPPQLAAHFEQYRATLRVADGKLVQSAEIVMADGKPALVSGWENPAVRSAGVLQRYAGTITTHEFGDVFLLDSGQAVELVGVRDLKPGQKVEGWGKSEGKQDLVSRPGQTAPKLRRVAVRPASLVDVQTLGRGAGGLLLLLPSTDTCKACQGTGRYEKRGELKRHCASCGGSGKDPKPQVVRTTGSR